MSIFNRIVFFNGKRKLYVERFYCDLDGEVENVGVLKGYFAYCLVYFIDSAADCAADTVNIDLFKGDGRNVYFVKG